MTPQIFRTNWTNTDEPLLPLSRLHLDKFNLQKATSDFLHIAGLPNYCEPNLSFANDTDDVVYGIHKLTDQYDLEEDNPDFEKYIVIGSCRDGDPIAIDTSDYDKIVELDDEDLFSPMYFNSSIETLAEFLILYRDFETEVLQDKNPEDNSRFLNFSDEQFEQLKSRMYAVDPEAITEQGFWSEELAIILALRQERFPRT